jgi:2-methylcitrate dehydratase PrpD
VLDAMGVAATQAGGLTGSFGTMSKPFHAGKAAMDGLLSALLASNGFTAAHDLFDRKESLADVLVQDGSITIRADALGDVWQITQNTFKPYASCLMTHAAIDAARDAARQVAPDAIDSATVDVHPLGLEVAGKTTVTTDLEGKFSLLYCTALGLLGLSASPADFADARRNDKTLRAMMSRIVVRPNPQLEKTAAFISVRRRDGTDVTSRVPLALGNPGNPMTWDALEAKFMALAEPRLKGNAARLFATVHAFEQLKDVRALTPYLTV